MVQQKLIMKHPKKMSVKGRMNTIIYLTFWWMLPVVVCDGWVEVVARKRCCVQRNLQWHGRDAAIIEHKTNDNMTKKTGSPLNTTINHRSGEGVDNKTYVKQKIGTKVQRKTLKCKRKWKSVDHHGGRIKTVHDGQWTIITVMQGVWVGWSNC